MSGIIVEYAKAKVNLALHVLGRRADGYHELDSIVAFADVADMLKVHKADHSSLDVSGPFSAGVPRDENNLIWRAYALLAKHAEMPPVHIQLQKNLPVAAGIGGGSADAAAALRAFLRLLNLDFPANKLNEIALQLGADVPVCLRQTSCRMQGVGEHLSDIAALPDSAIVLVNPGVACPTAAVFAELGLAKGAVYRAALAPGNSATWRNDLTGPACVVQPAISEVLSVLSMLPKVQTFRMSGSGATCFALFGSLPDAEDAAQRLKSLQPDWWCVAATLS